MAYTLTLYIRVDSTKRESALVKSAVFVQAVASVMTTRSNKVNYVPCNTRVFPAKNREDFSEKPLYKEECLFLPNSFRDFFSDYSSFLNLLRHDSSVRSQKLADFH